MPQDNPPLPPNFIPQGHTPMSAPPAQPQAPNFGQTIIPPGNGGGGQQPMIRYEPTPNSPNTPPYTMPPPTTPPPEMPPTTGGGLPITFVAPRIIGIIDDCMRSISVFDKNFPTDNGAIIDVTVNSVWRGSAISAAYNTEVL